MVMSSLPHKFTAFCIRQLTGLEVISKHYSLPKSRSDNIAFQELNSQQDFGTPTEINEFFCFPVVYTNFKQLLNCLSVKLSPYSLLIIDN